MTQDDLCPHSLPAYIPIGAVVRGEHPCEDCEADDWRLTGKPNLWLLGVLLALIYIPLFMLLGGVFW